MDTGAKTLYGVLGCAESATPGELKKAWRARLLEVHPDHGGSAAHTIEVQAAYDVLSDEIERRSYDRNLAAARARGGGASTPIDDLWDDLAQRFGDAFVRGFEEGMRNSAADSEDGDDDGWDDDEVSDESRYHRQSPRSRWTDFTSQDQAAAWARRTAWQMRPFCAATTKSGMPCPQRVASLDSAYCHAHNPNRRLCAGMAGHGRRPCRGTALAGQPYCYYHAYFYGTDPHLKPTTAKPRTTSSPTARADAPRDFGQQDMAGSRSGPGGMPPSVASKPIAGKIIAGIGWVWLCLLLIAMALSAAAGYYSDGAASVVLLLNLRMASPGLVAVAAGITLNRVATRWPKLTHLWILIPGTLVVLVTAWIWNNRAEVGKALETVAAYAFAIMILLWWFGRRSGTSR